jgi:long-subunit acyl-CoA synthetase (AMP-forming)
MMQNTILGLHALGIHKGDRVAIAGNNSLPWLCADLATLAGGLPNVVISPNVSDLTLSKILGHSRCRAVFIDGLAHRFTATSEPCSLCRRSFLKSEKIQTAFRNDR